MAGEGLTGGAGFGIDQATVERLAAVLVAAAKLGVELGVVVGGGNIFRGIAASASGMERASADYMGMLATVLNALALQNALERTGTMTRGRAGSGTRQRAEGDTRRRGSDHLEKKRGGSVAGGTGTHN